MTLKTNGNTERLQINSIKGRSFSPRRTVPVAWKHASLSFAPVSLKTVVLREGDFTFLRGNAKTPIFAFIPGVSQSGVSLIGSSRSRSGDRSMFLLLSRHANAGVATLIDWSAALVSLQGDVGRLPHGALVGRIITWVSMGWLRCSTAYHSFWPSASTESLQVVRFSSAFPQVRYNFSGCFAPTLWQMPQASV